MTSGRRFTLSDLGPGILLAATGIGVGDMVSSIISGAEYGLTLVWALALGVVMKFAIVEGAARWQLATGSTLIEGWRDHLPRALLAAFFLYFIVWSYSVSSALVAASTLVPAALLPGVPVGVWAIGHAGLALVLVFVGRYSQFLAVMKGFIGLKFGAVIATVLLILFRSGADWSTTDARSDLSIAYVLSLIGGIGGTVTLLSYGYWMREEGWTGPERMGFARVDLSVSFGLAFAFSLAMMFLSTQIAWSGQILEEGPRLCLLLADRIGAEIGGIGRAIFLVGFWGAAFSAVVGVWNGVPYLFDDLVRLWKRREPAGQTGTPYRSWAVYLTLASVSGVLAGRPVWLVFVYTIVGSLFFPFVIGTLLWLNNRRLTGVHRSGTLANVVLGAALVMYAWLATRALGG